MKEKEFKIPKNTIQPVNRRVFVIDKPAPEDISPAGIIMPKDLLATKGEDEVNVKVERYFVVDVAPDCDLTVEYEKGKERRKLQRGDEVYIFYPESALSYEKVIVFDHDASERFYTLDPSEIAAVKPGTGEFE